MKESEKKSNVLTKLKLERQKKRRTELASRSPQAFAQVYLKHYLKTGEVPDFHVEWYNLARGGEKVVIIAPRDHAKSFVFSLCLVLWAICYERKHFIVMSSDTIQQTKQKLFDVKFELETNQLLIEDFGDLSGTSGLSINDRKKWSESEIITTTGIRVLATGAGTSIRGARTAEHRPDMFIGDDMETDKHIDSPDYRDKMERWLKTVVLNLGNDDCQYVLVGTVLHFDSLLKRIQKNAEKERWHVSEYRAIKQDGSSLWPARWPLSKLDDKRDEVGTAFFNQEYMNIPYNDETSPFRMDEMTFYKDVDPNMLEFYLGIDPAISEKETADFTVVSVVGRHKGDGKIYTYRSHAKRLNFAAQVKFILDIIREIPKSQLKGVAVETVAYQQALAQHLMTTARQEGLYFPMAEIKPDKDKHRRAMGISKYTENGTVVIKESLASLIDQLINFGKVAHDDEFDAWEMACNLAMKKQSGGIASSGLSKPKRGY